MIPLRASARDIPANAKWSRNGDTVAGGHGKGDRINQLDSPNSLFVDDEETIYIVDTGNHRMVRSLLVVMEKALAIIN